MRRDRQDELKSEYEWVMAAHGAGSSAGNALSFLLTHAFRALQNFGEDGARRCLDLAWSGLWSQERGEELIKEAGNATRSGAKDDRLAWDVVKNQMLQNMEDKRELDNWVVAVRSLIGNSSHIWAQMWPHLFAAAGRNGQWGLAVASLAGMGVKGRAWIERLELLDAQGAEGLGTKESANERGAAETVAVESLGKPANWHWACEATGVKTPMAWARAAMKMEALASREEREGSTLRMARALWTRAFAFGSQELAKRAAAPSPSEPTIPRPTPALQGLAQLAGGEADALQCARTLANEGRPGAQEALAWAEEAVSRSGRNASQAKSAPGAQHEARGGGGDTAGEHSAADAARLDSTPRSIEPRRL